MGLSTVVNTLYIPDEVVYSIQRRSIDISWKHFLHDGYPI